MTTLLSNISTIFTSLVTWMGNVSTALISNEVFQIMLAIIIFVLLFGLLVGLAKGIRGRKRRR